jgi:hypothetical protein
VVVVTAGAAGVVEATTGAAVVLVVTAGAGLAVMTTKREAGPTVAGTVAEAVTT